MEAAASSFRRTAVCFDRPFRRRRSLLLSVCCARTHGSRVQRFPNAFVMVLTPHQEAFIQRREEGNSYLVAPPGSGKTTMAMHKAEQEIRKAHGDDCGHLIVLIVLNASAVKDLAMIAECTLNDINNTLAQKQGRTALLLTNGSLFWRSFVPKEHHRKNKWSMTKDFKKTFNESCNKKGVKVSFIIDECHKLTSTKLPKAQVLADAKHGFPWANILGMTGTDTFLRKAQQELYRNVLRPGSDGKNQFPLSSFKLVMTDEEYQCIQCELPINPGVQTVQLVGCRQLSPGSQTAEDVALCLSMLAKYKEVGLTPVSIHNCLRVVLQRHNDELFYKEMVEFLNCEPHVEDDEVQNQVHRAVATESGFYYQAAISAASIPGQVRELAQAIEKKSDKKFQNSLANEKLKKDTENLMAIVKGLHKRAHCVVITGNTSASDVRRSMEFFKKRFESFGPRFQANFFDATGGVGSFQSQIQDIYTTVYSKKVAFVFASASIATSTNSLVGPVTAVAARGLLSWSGARQLAGRVALRPITASPFRRPRKLLYFETVSQVLTEVNEYLKKKDATDDQVDRAVTRRSKKARYTVKTPQEIEKEFPLNGQLDDALRQGNGIAEILKNKRAAKQKFDRLKQRMCNLEDTSNECEDEEGMEREDGLDSDAESTDSDK